jgi:hypothetical protein
MKAVTHVKYGERANHSSVSITTDGDHHLDPCLLALYGPGGLLNVDFPTEVVTVEDGRWVPTLDESHLREAEYLRKGPTSINRRIGRLGQAS